MRVLMLETSNRVLPWSGLCFPDLGYQHYPWLGAKTLHSHHRLFRNVSTREERPGLKRATRFSSGPPLGMSSSGSNAVVKSRKPPCAKSIPASFGLSALWADTVCGTTNATSRLMRFSFSQRYPCDEDHYQQLAKNIRGLRMKCEVERWA